MSNIQVNSCMAGKGDKCRIASRKKYRDNFNLIDWGPKKKKAKNGKRVRKSLS